MKKKIYNIGVVIGNVYTNHPQELLHGICDAAKKLPVNLQLFPGTQSNAFYKNITDMVLNNNFDYQFNTIYDFALFGNLDAVIISYGTLCIFLREDEKADFFKKYAALPQVVLEEPSEQKNASWFISDNYEGICRIMEHLIAHHGCRSILHVGGPRDNTDAKQRRQGYLDTMAKYNLSVEEGMMIYGDYSQYMDEEIEALLCRYPQAQALCCANDDMAVSAYRVCKKLGLVVGRDIAVTGYDNLGIAAAMDPPLTTVDQNGYAIGYRALEEAWRLCGGSEETGNLVPANLAFRESCGCNYAESAGIFSQKQEREKAGLEKAAEMILGEDILREFTRETVRKYRGQMLELLQCIFCDKEAEGHEERLKEALDAIGQTKKNIELFAHAEVERRLGSLLAEAMTRVEEKERRKQIVCDFTQTREFFQNRKNYEWEMRHTDSERKNWLGPLFVRDLLEYGYHEKDALAEAVAGMKRLGIRSSRILLFEQPIVHGPADTWVCPKQLRLAAFHEGESLVAFGKEERPVITRENGFGQFLTESGHMLVAFSLFNQQKQYGILLCEIGVNEISSTYIISIQLGTALRFFEMSRQEHLAGEKLRIAMEEVEKKNRILEFVSKSDPLTGLMNRRGLIESLLEEMQRREGERACMIIADLDHLKQINDNFGHTEGDCAICKIGETLAETVGENALVARIGGDEFVSVIFGEVEAGELTADIRTKCTAYNEGSGKPYLVECSVGFVEFICRQGLETGSLFEQADRVMYKVKKHRRKSVLRAKVIPDSTDKYYS